jgi:hypothetical protein
LLNRNRWQSWVDNADELAERFEDYEPNEADERSIEEYLLRRAELSRRQI